MARVVIDRDERWPDFVVEECSGGPHFGRAVDIPDDLLARIRAAEAEYNDVQGTLYALWERGERVPRSE